MKRILLLTALSLGLFAADALAQPPGGGGGGGMGMMRRPDMRAKLMFAQLCFDLNATDAQVTKALPIFRDAIAKLGAIMQKHSEPNEAAMNEVQQVQSDLEAKVKALLTPEQQQELAKMEVQQQQWRERRGGGGPGGGGPPR